MSLPGAFLNDAGAIQNLIEHPCGSVAVIHSKAGSVRSNHYHKTDWHYLYVLSGRMIYEERELHSAGRRVFAVEAGEMVFTPPMLAHVTRFPVDTVLVSMSMLSRTHANHEEDVVRL